MFHIFLTKPAFNAEPQSMFKAFGAFVEVISEVKGLIPESLQGKPPGPQQEVHWEVL